MLITIKKPKLVLGRTVYRRGDVFECRDAEAKLFIVSGLATKSPDGVRATKSSPMPPTINLSLKPAKPPLAKPAHSLATPKPPEQHVTARPVGAMTMQQPVTTPPVSPPASTNTARTV